MTHFTKNAWVQNKHNKYAKREMRIVIKNLVLIKENCQEVLGL